MRKTSVHSLKICKIVATFIFKKVGFDQFWGNFGACTDEKSHFWPFLADLRKLGVEKPLKSPLAHFYFLFNCDKKF